ncbi:MAG: phosphatidate cytidylyltransferase [Gammaproteobacteria bacterium]|nr:phosphatidate cytidylyltransferase [Gammaproteobacteria bacterium]MCW9004762.1 phosphatidate cytidylyltransferase [Gammaproteobacteria bacterium]MCW9055045.1 phosphatidate cytidylyltransferase [Gammaproteobacteria bacterium]
MLLQRILTAVPLGILSIWFILTQSSDALFYALLVVVFIAGWEWAQLAGLNSVFLRLVYAFVVLAVAFFSYSLLDQEFLPWFKLLMAITFLWWLFIIYRMSISDPKAPSSESSLLKIFTGFLILIPPILALVYIHQSADGAHWLLYSIIIVWIADSGAYFSGRKYGKKKLAVKISPGKTVEGLYGAVMATTVYTFAAALFFQLDVMQTAILLIIGFFATLISVAGDLYISLLKRERGVKDSGSILPGHGGVLDRIDSITSSAPFFALFLGVMVFNV